MSCWTTAVEINHCSSSLQLFFGFRIGWFFHSSGGLSAVDGTASQREAGMRASCRGEGGHEGHDGGGTEAKGGAEGEGGDRSATAGAGKKLKLLLFLLPVLLPSARLTAPSFPAGSQGSAHQALQAAGSEEERASSHRPPVSQLLRPFPLVILLLTAHFYTITFLFWNFYETLISSCCPWFQPVMAMWK